MAKILIMYEQPTVQEAFEKFYFGVHIPLIQKLPNLKNISISRVLQSQNTDANLYLIAELEYDNTALLNESLGSPMGQKVQEDIANLMNFLPKPPVVSILQ